MLIWNVHNSLDYFGFITLYSQIIEMLHAGVNIDRHVNKQWKVEFNQSIVRI